MAKRVVDDPAVTAMTRWIVTELAPEELEFFQDTVEVLPLAPLRRMRRRLRRRRSGPLAFGLVESAAVVVTGIAAGAAHEVVKTMAEGAGEGMVGRLRRRLQRRRARADGTAGAPAGTRTEVLTEALTDERIAELGRVAARTAVLLGMPEGRSALLARAVADHLRNGGGRPR